MRDSLSSIGVLLSRQDRLARASALDQFALDVATNYRDDENLFMARPFRFVDLVMFGQWEETQSMWRLLDPMGRHWSRAV